MSIPNCLHTYVASSTDNAMFFGASGSMAGGQVMGWYGYLLVASEGEVEPGNYTLALEDGRSGTIRIDRLEPDDSGKCRAVFVGEGPLG